MASIILTGSGGLVGARLSEQLLSDGHQLTHLASSTREGRVPTLTYDPMAETMPELARKALLDSDIVIHLAGEPIAARRWSKPQKERIQSRVQSTALLRNTIIDAKKKANVIRHGTFRRRRSAITEIAAMNGLTNRLNQGMTFSPIR